MAPPAERHIGLGKGLGALIPQTSPAGAAPVEIPISRIKRNPYQPRQRVEQQALEQLAASIAVHGVLQPVLVTETLDGYQLVAGERRVRAAQIAGLDRVPAIVRQMAAKDQLAIAIVENIQRADLNAMEEAHAYRQLADEFKLTQDEIATSVGRARSTIANTLRLLDLEPAVQQALGDGDITEGHARALIGTPRGRPEAAPRGGSWPGASPSARPRSSFDACPTSQAGSAKPTAPVDGEMEGLEEDLRRALGTKVSVARSRKGGRIVIEYYSDEEFSRLFDRLTGGNA